MYILSLAVLVRVSILLDNGVRSLHICKNVVALSNLLCMHCAVVCSLTHCGFMGVLSPVMRASIPRKSIVRLGCAIKHWAITMLRVNALSLQSLWSQTLLQFLLNLLMHTLLREMSAGRSCIFARPCSRVLQSSSSIYLSLILFSVSLNG